MQLQSQNHFKLIPDDSNIIRDVYVIICKTKTLLEDDFKSYKIINEPYEIFDFSEIKNKRKTLLLTCKYIILSKEIDENIFKKADTLFSFTFLRLLCVSKIFSMEFLGSFGQLNKLRKYFLSQEKKTFNFQDCFKYNRLNIITGCPGMGQSKFGELK